MTHQDSAIGVFDSGIGGFTVLHKIIEARPTENTIYLRDPRDYPMAQKSPDTVRHYSFENCKFLVGKHIKLVLVACNTASAIAVDQ